MTACHMKTQIRENAEGEDEKRLKGRSADGGRGGGSPVGDAVRRMPRREEPSPPCQQEEEAESSSVPLAPALRLRSFAVAF